MTPGTHQQPAKRAALSRFERRAGPWSSDCLVGGSGRRPGRIMVERTQPVDKLRRVACSGSLLSSNSWHTRMGTGNHLHDFSTDGHCLWYSSFSGGTTGAYLYERRTEWEHQ